jgi:hypothetical protein
VDASDQAPKRKTKENGMKNIQDIMRALGALKNDLQRHQTLTDAPLAYDLLLVSAQNHFDDAMDDLEQIQNYEFQSEDDKKEGV